MRSPADQIAATGAIVRSAWRCRERGRASRLRVQVRSWCSPSPRHELTRTASYQGVHIPCDTANVFLVLVLDLWRQQVHGHHVLDLRRLYG